jgi:hypothetical protein
MEVRLDAGANLVPEFAGDGRTALITLGWRDNGNAHGFDVYEVLLPGRPGARDWNVVGVETKEGLDTTVTDDPHTGIDMVRSVRFARGLLDGRPATLLITATRELSLEGGIPDPSHVVIELAALRQNTEGVGSTREYFETVASYKTSSLYCNAQMALNQELGLALPRSYAGPRTVSGCSR